MGDTTGIEWTDSTWNPVSGCSKVSQGCKHCYAERLFPRPYPGRKFTDVRVHEDRLTQPLTWVKGRRIFVNSMSDLFHEDVPFEFIAKVFAVMACTTRHTYQVLTKRPERMVEFFAWLRDENDEERSALDAAADAASPHRATREYGQFFWPEQVRPTEVWPDWIPHGSKRGGYDNCGPIWPLVNVWLGVSVEDQKTADDRIPLLQLAPAEVRFLSCEPLLGFVDLRELRPSWCESKVDCLLGRERTGTLLDIRVPRIDWVIAGGESGPRARPTHPHWFRSLRDQCAAAGVPFFFKQHGEWSPVMTAPVRDSHRWPIVDGEAPGGIWSYRIGKKAAGRLLDGRTWDEFPQVQP